ncbi:MAG: hypothetical protein U0941_18990 [Planctomycetaceae bacterium]
MVTFVRDMLGLALCFLGMQTANELWAAPPPTTEIAAEITRQDLAWDDLEVRYQFDAKYLTDDDQWQDQPQLRMKWILTKGGWQRVRRERDKSSGETWVEEASFDGEYYMSGDSQSAGSGAIGHQNERFLYNSNVPRMFGLAVTGVELSMPVSVAEFLTSKTSAVVVEEAGDGLLLIVKGADPMAVGVMLELHLDPTVGYRPRKMVISDEQGLLSIYSDLEYQKCEGSRGHFWFPVHGVWRGYSPRNRVEVSRTTYHAQEVLVNTNPDRDKFVLTYPSGALLLNSDTGESFYLNSDSTTADVPNFAGKRLTLWDHDRQRENDLRSVVRQTVASRRLSPFIVINLIIFVAAVAVLAVWNSRKQA